jgi:soluble lytic murein transglycosylase-like protein
MLAQPHQFIIALILTSCGLVPFAAQADVFEYIDEAGITHYADTLINNSYVLIIKSELPITESTQLSTLNTASSDDNLTDSLTSPSPILFLAPPQLLAQIAQSAQNNHLDSELIHAVMHVESAYKTKAKSHKGAQGLMQLMPATAYRLGVKNIYDPTQNIEGGAKYLRELLTLFDNDTTLAIAAYNAGENAVIRHGNKIPPYKETQAYVPKVLNIYKALLKQRKQVM